MSNTPQLTAVEHYPPTSGTTRKLVVFLHGVGSNAQDLIQLAPMWAEELPDVEFISPNAPYPFDMAEVGYQWFSLKDRDPHQLIKDAEAARPLVDNFIESLAKDKGLTTADIALVGFSQGSMMALLSALQRTTPLAGVVAYSGALLLDDASRIKSKSSVLLVHGQADEVVPVEATQAAAQFLQMADVPVQSVLCPDTGHGIDDRGLDAGLRFLKRIFGY